MTSKATSYYAQVRRQNSNSLVCGQDRQHSGGGKMFTKELVESTSEYSERFQARLPQNCMFAHVLPI